MNGAAPCSTALTLEDALENLGGASQRRDLVRAQLAQPASEVGGPARAQAAQQLPAAGACADQRGTPVGGVFGTQDQALQFEASDHSCGRGPLDALEVGQLAWGQRSVTLDGSQRGDQGAPQVYAGLLSQSSRRS